MINFQYMYYIVILNKQNTKLSKYFYRIHYNNQNQYNYKLNNISINTTLK